MDLEKLMRASPYHRWLGVQMVRAEGEEVEVLLPYRVEFQGDEAGTNIHGGIIATLADITACFAVMNSIQRDAPNMDLHVDYLRMAPAGSDLHAIGRTVKVGRTIGLADVEIRTEDRRLIAVGRSKVVTNAPSRETLTQKEGQ